MIQRLPLDPAPGVCILWKIRGQVWPIRFFESEESAQEWSTLHAITLRMWEAQGVVSCISPLRPTLPASIAAWLQPASKVPNVQVYFAPAIIGPVLGAGAALVVPWSVSDNYRRHLEAQLQESLDRSILLSARVDFATTLPDAFRLTECYAL